MREALGLGNSQAGAFKSKVANVIFLAIALIAYFATFYGLRDHGFTFRFISGVFAVLIVGLFGGIISVSKSK